MSRTLPSKDRLTICFAHVAYRMGERFELRNTGMRWFEVRSLDELEKRYAHHESWHGLALQLGPETYANLPGPNWGFDDVTIGRPWCNELLSIDLDDELLGKGHQQLVGALADDQDGDRAGLPDAFDLAKGLSLLVLGQQAMLIGVGDTHRNSSGDCRRPPLAKPGAAF